jgi:hypothetical protein
LPTSHARTCESAHVVRTQSPVVLKFGRRPSEQRAFARSGRLAEFDLAPFLRRSPTPCKRFLENVCVFTADSSRLRLVRSAGAQYLCATGRIKGERE